MLTNTEEWELKSIEAGRTSGDLLAPIIYCPELHFSEYASAMADMKNSVAVSGYFFNILILVGSVLLLLRRFSFNFDVFDH